MDQYNNEVPLSVGDFSESGVSVTRRDVELLDFKNGSTTPPLIPGRVAPPPVPPGVPQPSRPSIAPKSAPPLPPKMAGKAPPPVPGARPSIGGRQSVGGAHGVSAQERVGVSEMINLHWKPASTHHCGPSNRLSPGLETDQFLRPFSTPQSASLEELLNENPIPDVVSARLGDASVFSAPIISPPKLSVDAVKQFFAKNRITNSTRCPTALPDLA